jgi:uncharacterized protein YlxW (UPF0749 family)
MPGIRVPIIGDSRSVLRAFEQTKVGASSVGAEVNKVNLSVARSAELQGKAAVTSIGRLRAQVVEYQRLGAAVAAGSTEQIAYTQLAAKAQARLNTATGVTVATTGGFSKATRTAESDVNKLTRGVLSGSGVLSRFSRTLAFSSSGFIAAAIGAAGVAASVKDAEALGRAQASLGVAIRHTGGDLKTLQPQYEATAKAAAQFGISEIDATAGLARATLLTGNAAAAQRAYQEALVISKATGKDFNAVLIAAAKGQEGITFSLRRYGILVDSTTSGTEQFRRVMKRFGGQAAANTTETEKLDAAFKNVLTTAGVALLPTFNRLAGGLADWLTKMNESGKLEKDVAQGMTAIHAVASPLITSMKDLATVVSLTADSYAKLKSIWSHFPGSPKLPGLPSLGSFFSPLGPLNPLHPLQPAIDALLPKTTHAPVTQVPAQFQAQLGIRTKDIFAGVPKSHPGGPFGKELPLTQYFKTFQLNFAEQLAQARAALTRGNNDDVAEARKEVARIKRLIDEGRLHGQALLQALALKATAEGTIQTAEQAAAQKRQAVAQARLSSLQTEKSQLDQHLQTLKQQDANLSQRIKAIQDRYRQTVQSITQGIGQLFQGPVLAPTDAQRKTALGLPGPTAHRLTEDLTAQVSQYRRLNRDLGKLQREGASKALVAELRGQGVSAIPEIEALTGAGKGQRDSFFKAFAARERLAQTTAKQMLSAQLHTISVDQAQLRAIRAQERTVTAGDKLIAGKIDKLARAIKTGGVRTTGSGQTSGRNPGR